MTDSARESSSLQEPSVRSHGHCSDEPTAFLDIRHKLELLYLLKKYGKGKAGGVLMSLHELDAAQKISDHHHLRKGDNSY